MLERFDSEARELLLRARARSSSVTSTELALELLGSRPDLFDDATTEGAEARIRAVSSVLTLAGVLTEIRHVRPAGPVGVTDIADALAQVWAPAGVRTRTQLGEFLRRVEQALSLSDEAERRLVARVQAEGLDSDAALQLVQAGLPVVVRRLQETGRPVTLGTLLDANRVLLDALGDLTSSTAGYLELVESRLTDHLAS